MMKLAGAPISWGVCEVPGWGHQLEPSRVLTEMRDVGLSATELGPDGFLPTDPEALTDLLGTYGLGLVGAFAPVLLHDATHDPVPDIDAPLDALIACGAGVLVLAAATGAEGYDARPTLDEHQWTVLLTNLDRLVTAASDRGVLAVLHPHVGTMVETEDDVNRVLDGSSVQLCLDTGHLMIGGTDPLRLATDAPDRIAHVHLKDVDATLAGRVRSGELTYTDGVRAGMYTPLGSGDVDITGIVSALVDNGYSGWFVMEQDTILEGAPHDEGPLRDVRTSVAFMTEMHATA